MLLLLRSWLYACMRVLALRYGNMIVQSTLSFLIYLRSYSFAREFEGGGSFPVKERYECIEINDQKSCSTLTFDHP
ncbi:hypothetical protein EV401DRAFT_1131273 [Pisolithus croceorrhizus]|nr:hypothetical protein EV401DRAFT_1131273 [Pisolithus croceorrhizus]